MVHFVDKSRRARASYIQNKPLPEVLVLLCTNKMWNRSFSWESVLSVSHELRKHTAEPHHLWCLMERNSYSTKGWIFSLSWKTMSYVLADTVADTDDEFENLPQPAAMSVLTFLSAIFAIRAMIFFTVLHIIVWTSACESLCQDIGGRDRGQCLFAPFDSFWSWTCSTHSLFLCLMSSECFLLC